MTACWITRNADGIVRAAVVAAYCTPEILKEWRDDGRTPELVDFGPGGCCTLNKPLPPEARVIE